MGASSFDWWLTSCHLLKKEHGRCQLHPDSFMCSFVSFAKISAFGNGARALFLFSSSSGEWWW